jgi:hypothetical protein
MSEPTAPSSASRGEDFIDVFLAPAALFRRRSDGKFGHGLLVLVLLMAIIFIATRNAMEPILNAEFQRAMASRPNLTPEQIETGRRFASSLAPLTILIGTPITLFVLGAVIWMVARLIGGANRLSYAQTATIATFSWFPKVIEFIVSGAQALLMDESKLTSRYSVSVGIGRLLDPTSTGGMLLALLGRIDVFTLWVTVLIGVGIKQMARTSTAQAAVAAALMWLVGALPFMWQAFRAG